jgi:hypothetical protein
MVDNTSTDTLDAKADRYVVDSRSFVDFVTSKAVDAADARIWAREERRHRSMIWLTSIFGAIGIGGIAGAIFLGVNYLETRQKAQINEAVANALHSTQFKEGLAEIDGLVAYQQFVSLVTLLDLKPSFTRDERDGVLALLSQIKKAGLHKKREDFPILLSKVADSFTSAGQVVAIDRVDDLFRDELSKLDSVPRWLARHYGRTLLVSDAIADKKSSEWEKFSYYARYTKDNGDPQVGMLFRALCEFVIANRQRTAVVDSIVAKMGTLSDVDRRAMFKLISRRVQEIPDSDSDSIQLRNIFQKFTEVYGVELAALGYASQ